MMETPWRAAIHHLPQAAICSLSPSLNCPSDEPEHDTSSSMRSQLQQRRWNSCTSGTSNSNFTSSLSGQCPPLSPRRIAHDTNHYLPSQGYQSMGTGQSCAQRRGSGLSGTTAMSKSIEEMEESHLRQSIREELLKRLINNNLGGHAAASASKQSPQVQAAFAERLEELLFKTSKSVASYSDITTLDKRLRTLITTMQKRKDRSSASAIATAKQGTKQSTSSTERQKRDVLVRLLGHAKMVRVFKIVAEIKLIQLGREVTEGKPFAARIRKCGPSGCSFMVPCERGQKAPKVVKDLFFNTAIVTAMEKSTPEQLEKLPWDELLAQGDARLAAYHDWFRQRTTQRGGMSDL